MKIKNNRTYLIVGIIILLVVIGVGLFIRNRIKSSEEQNALTQEEVIPTVDSSVKVQLTPVKKGEVKLTIKNAPSGTSKVEYELTYDAKTPASDEGEGGVVPQGAIGKCSRIDSSRDWECKSTNREDIVLGTCSSGTCIFHEVVGKVKVRLKFSGSYGARIFEKDYDLNKT